MLKKNQCHILVSLCPWDTKPPYLGPHIHEAFLWLLLNGNLSPSHFSYLSRIRYSISWGMLLFVSESRFMIFIKMKTENWTLGWLIWPPPEGLPIILPWVLLLRGLPVSHMSGPMVKINKCFSWRAQVFDTKEKLSIFWPRGQGQFWINVLKITNLPNLVISVTT